MSQGDKKPKNSFFSGELTLRLFPRESGEHIKWARRIVSFLKNLQVGAVTSAPAMKFFPLTLPSRDKTFSFPVLLVDEAVSSGLVEVTETGNIRKLRVKNFSPYRILILDGTTFIGGAQNRVAMVPFVLEPFEELLFPVVCIEKNRWEPSREGERFTDIGFSFLYLRIKKLHLMLEQAAVRLMTFDKGATEGTFFFGEREQREIWEVIDDLLIHQKMPIDTGDFHRIYFQKRSILERSIQGIRYRPRQLGMAAYISGNLYLDFFSSYELLWSFFPELLLSYAVDALRRNAYSFLRAFKPSHKFDEKWLKAQIDSLSKGNYFVFSMGSNRKLVLGLGKKFALLVLGYDEYLVYGNVFWALSNVETYL